MKTIIALLLIATIIPNKTMTVTSTAFGNNEMIPSKYTCDGADVNPPLLITEIPDGTKSLALIVDDPDVLDGTVDHWVMWNMPVMADIDENTASGTQGRNKKGNNTYMGPCPPSGTHHYHFRVYALDTKLELDEGAGKKTLLNAMQGHIVGMGELVGIYRK
jgi:Raf kinase inhibitor-like YbhB/YbcL family protein